MNNWNLNTYVIVKGTRAMLAQAELSDALGKVAGVIQAISAILFFAGLIYASVSFMYGRTEGLKNGLIGAAIGALAWVIVRTFFEVGTGADPGIDLQPLN